MVYTGKPSRACQTCKNRRIKCDEARPICGQCKKSKRECPGYPDEFDLVFRDENKAMQQRKGRKTAALRRSSTQQTSSSTEVSPRSSFEVAPGTGPYRIVEEDPAVQVVQQTPATQAPQFPTPAATPAATSGYQEFAIVPYHYSPPIQTPPIQTLPVTTPPIESIIWDLENSVPPTITLPPEFEAVPFFFKNFVSLPQQAESMRGFLELLVPLYNQARPSSAMHLATNAVALACIGNYPGRAEQLRDAVTTYGRALRKVKQDLEDPIMSKSDETVLAILMFSLYETIMSTDSSIQAWGNHVDGAIALTKLRGTEQFKNPMSHAVFRAVRTMMITSCVQRSKPLPSFPSTTGWHSDDLHTENAANRLTLICMDLPNLRARANTLTSTPYSASLRAEIREILITAQTVDTNLAQWYATLPAEWRHQTVGMVYTMPDDISEAESWVGPLHAYHDVPLASIINDYRVCRIFCQRVILACIDWLNSEKKPVHKDDGAEKDGAGQSGGAEGVAEEEVVRGANHDDPAYRNAIFVIQEMVDEISACVTFHLTYDMQPVAKELGQEQNAAEAFGGYSLVWPLYVAANTESIPQRQRDWLSGRLYSIGTRFGLSTAQVLVLARKHVLSCGPIFP